MVRPRRRCRRSEEHTSELQSCNDSSYAVFCLKKKKSGGAAPRRPPGRPDRPPRSPVGRSSSERSGGQFFFFSDTATTEIYTSLHTLSLHDALPISHELRTPLTSISGFVDTVLLQW